MTSNLTTESISMKPHMSRFAVRGRALLLALAVAAPAACIPDRALDVTDPDVVDASNINSPAAAEGLRLGALARLNAMMGGTGNSDEGVMLFPGLLVDEWRSGDTFNQRDLTDQRAVDEATTVISAMWYNINRTRTASNQAIAALRQFPPAAASALPLNNSNIGQMYWLRGFAEMHIAANYCNGTPISELNFRDQVITFGNPESNAQVFARAISSFDSATSSAGVNARGDTVRILARIGRARVYTMQGQYAKAAAEIAASPAIPTTFRYFIFFQEAVSGTPVNQIWALNNSGRRYVVGNRDGGVGLDFATAGDPRVPTCTGGSAACLAIGVASTISFDNNFGPQTTRIGGPFYVQMIWPSRDDDIVIVSGVEARLIEAEAQLNSGDVTGWLATLNTLRASFATVKDPTNASTGTLAPLTDPGTTDSRVDLMFRERAFWLFSRGHRLADARRLVRPTSQGGYGRPVNSVYPNGPFFKGGTYGSDVNIIVPQTERNNPNFMGCTDRNP